jgi:hypothetical protein
MSVSRRTVIVGLAALGGISWTLRPRDDRALRLRPPGARAPGTARPSTRALARAVSVPVTVALSASPAQVTVSARSVACQRRV